MAVPRQADFYRPVLEIASHELDGLSRNQLIENVAKSLEIGEEDRNHVFGGKSAVNIVDHRAYSAGRKLEDAGLLSRPKRGHFVITDEGRNFLNTHQGAISRAELKQLANAIQTDGGESVAGDDTDDENQDATEEIAPTVLMRQAYERQVADLVSELLAFLKGVESDTFEDLVGSLLVRMGYGEVQPRGPRTRDGGIDGVIDQDKLGLDKVLLQAKRWDGNPVREPQVREFSGSLLIAGANKGVFITTSRFTDDAQKFADALQGQSIRLINGQELARLMIEYDVGVVKGDNYQIKKLDENYFAGEN